MQNSNTKFKFKVQKNFSENDQRYAIQLTISLQVFPINLNQIFKLYRIWKKYKHHPDYSAFEICNNLNNYWSYSYNQITYVSHQIYK